MTNFTLEILSALDADMEKVQSRMLWALAGLFLSLRLISRKKL